VCVRQNVIDGDLCEMFNALDASKQKTVAEELDRTPSEVRHAFHRFTCIHSSHASWKVLDFFLENSRTWKVLENHFGPGKSWKLKLKILESPGKIS